jgi:hypothetical protein
MILKKYLNYVFSFIFLLTSNIILGTQNNVKIIYNMENESENYPCKSSAKSGLILTNR